MIHRDQDYGSEDRSKKFKEKLESVELAAFLTEPNDIEGYFLNAEHLNFLNPKVSVIEAQKIIDDCVAATKSKSLEAMVNLRTEQAFRERSSSGKAPDHGKIATEALADYDKNPKKFCRGDIVIGQVSAELQKTLGENPTIFEPSQFLKSAILTEVSKKIWKPIDPAVANGA